MKNKIIFSLTVVFAYICLNSCGISSNLNGQNQDLLLTNVSLSQNNYRIVGEAEGSASATYVFGIGGLSKRALEGNAHAEMVKNAHLRGSQAIINKTVDSKVQFYFLVTKNTVTVRGLIVEFNDGGGKTEECIMPQVSHSTQQTTAATPLKEEVRHKKDSQRASSPTSKASTKKSRPVTTPKEDSPAPTTTIAVAETSKEEENMTDESKCNRIQELYTAAQTDIRTGNLEAATEKYKFACDIYGTMEGSTSKVKTIMETWRTYMKARGK